MNEDCFKYRYFVRCPFCNAICPLPDDEPEDLFCVVGCLDCDRTFDYEPEDVETVQPPEQQSPPRRIE